MIINLRGTSGSGKSTVVRRVVGRYHREMKLFVPPDTKPKRRNPIGYVYGRPDGKELFVPGHYETQCGGCDTIKTVDQVYELVREHTALGRDVLFEGIMVQDDVRRALAFRKEFPDVPWLVIRMRVPIEVCLDSVRARRLEKGNEEPLNPKNTENRYKTVIRNCDRLKMNGMPVEALDREEAVQRCWEVLGWKD